MVNRIVSSSIRLYSFISLGCIGAALSLALFIVPAISKIDRTDLGIARAIVLISGADIGQAFLANVFIGILMGIQRFDIFSKINIAQSYNQISVHPDHVQRTAFQTKFVSYQFNVMPFWLCNAASTFQRTMNDLLR